jgi:chromate reductase
MNTLPTVFAIIGSTRTRSANLQLVQYITNTFSTQLNIEIYTRIDSLPHFNPDLDNHNVPEQITTFRDKIMKSDAVLICTPEYVFSLPGSLKNALEWAVSTTVFSDKPTALITASGLGEKAHESLQLIMRTLGVRSTDEMQLWIKGIRSKINEDGTINDAEIIKKIHHLIDHLIECIHQS